MKVRYITALFLLACVSASAQFPLTAGTWKAALGLCFDNQTSNDWVTDPNSTTNPPARIELKDKYNQFGLKVSGAYAIKDNQFVGLTIGLDNEKWTEEDVSSGIDGILTYTEKMGYFKVMPMYEIYNPCSPKFAYVHRIGLPLRFGNGSYQVQSSDPNFNGTPETKLPSSFGWGIKYQPTLALLITQRLLLEASFGRVGYFSESWEDDNGEKYTDSQFIFKFWPLISSFRLAYTFPPGRGWYDDKEAAALAD